MDHKEGVCDVICINTEDSEEEEEEKSDHKVIKIRQDATFVIGIDPGPRHMGVCLYHVEGDTVLDLVEFNLSNFSPTASQKGISCFSTTKAVSSNFGVCVLSMIESHKAIFRPDVFRDTGRYKTTLYVAIEIQMNESPDNCCVLSALQTYYGTHNIECHILSTKTLNSCFPQVFLGTEKNRPLRKRRIREFGYAMLWSSEKFASMQYQKRYVDPPIPPGSRKRGRQKPSEHALDAMFYALVACVHHPMISRNVFRDRQKGNSQLSYMLKQVACKSCKLLAGSEESEDFLEAVRKTKNKKNKRKKKKDMVGKKNFWAGRKRRRTTKAK